MYSNCGGRIFHGALTALRLAVHGIATEDGPAKRSGMSPFGQTQIALDDTSSVKPEICASGGSISDEQKWVSNSERQSFGRRNNKGTIMRTVANVFESLAKWAAIMETNVKELEARISELEMVRATGMARPEHDCRQSVADEVDSRFPSINEEQRSHVDTACAAHWLNRKPQTLRQWACLENGPLRPIRINRHLAWSVEEIRQLMCLSKRSRSK